MLSKALRPEQTNTAKHSLTLNNNSSHHLLHALYDIDTGVSCWCFTTSQSVWSPQPDCDTNPKQLIPSLTPLLNLNNSSHHVHHTHYDADTGTKQALTDTPSVVLAWLQIGHSYCGNTQTCVIGRGQGHVRATCRHHDLLNWSNHQQLSWSPHHMILAGFLSKKSHEHTEQHVIQCHGFDPPLSFC